jgi:hypothetical protein
MQMSKSRFSAVRDEDGRPRCAASSRRSESGLAEIGIGPFPDVYEPFSFAPSAAIRRGPQSMLPSRSRHHPPGRIVRLRHCIPLNLRAVA